MNLIWPLPQILGSGNNPLGTWSKPMEKTIDAIQADIIRLRENVARFRRLAEERKAADHLMIATKLTEVAADFEAKAAELERLLNGGLATD